MKHLCLLLLPVTALLATSSAWSAPAADPAFDAGLLAIQQAWAHVNYEMPAGDARVREFEALERRAEKFTHEHPGRAEALIWEGIVESSYAGAKGGLGALSLCKEAKGNLEAALAIDPKSLDGSAYTSLGTLYFKVPGFPLGFGNDDKAGQLLRKALELNPNGIDPNYFYAEYLHDQDRDREALQYLDRAARAPARSGRETADRGRQDEVVALRRKLQGGAG